MGKILSFVGPVLAVVVGVWIATIVPNPLSMLKK
jgi:hypothetical protein